MKTFIIKNVLVYCYEQKRIQKRDIQIKDGRIYEIADVIDTDLNTLGFMDGGGCMLLPGMIDLHNDEIEGAVAPKRGCFFCDDSQFEDLMLGYYSSGITTVYHAVSFSAEPGIRNEANAHKLIAHLKKFKSSFRFPGSIKINLRAELTSDWTYMQSVINEFRDEINVISFGDHSPDNRQGWTKDKFYRYILSRAKIGQDDYEKLLERMYLNKRKNVSVFPSFIQEQREKGIVIGLHDLTEETECVSGMDFGEFPTNMKMIDYLRVKGKKVVMGAPNIRNGKSINNNVSAFDVCKAEKCHILCSDYDHVSMLQCLRMYDERFFDWYQYVSENPAKLLGLNKGKIEIGYDADFILVDSDKGHLHVRKTIIGGKLAYESHL